YHKTKKVPVFIEVQKDKMDLIHFKKIEELIEQIDEGIIVWIFTKITTRFVNKLEVLALTAEKNLEVLFVAVEDDIISQLSDLEREDPITVFKQIKNKQLPIPRLLLETGFTVGDSFTQNHIPDASYTGNEKVNRELLSRLRY